MLHDALEHHLKDVFAVLQGDLRDGQEKHVAGDGSVHWEKVGKEIGFKRFCLLFIQDKNSGIEYYNNMEM